MGKSALLEPFLFLERMEISSQFVANLGKLIVQNKVDKWLNKRHKVRNDAQAGAVLDKDAKQPRKELK